MRPKTRIVLYPRDHAKARFAKMSAQLAVTGSSHASSCMQTSVSCWGTDGTQLLGRPLRRLPGCAIGHTFRVAHSVTLQDCSSLLGLLRMPVAAEPDPHPQHDGEEMVALASQSEILLQRGLRRNFIRMSVFFSLNHACVTSALALSTANLGPVLGNA